MCVNRMQIKPFRAFRFDPDVVGNVGDCIAPPYDVISAAQQRRLYERNQYNVVRIIKPETGPAARNTADPYTRAAACLHKWIQTGVLKQDSTEAIYGYLQDFQIASKAFRRLSFIALARLEEFGPPGPVRPHERVLNEPVLDRLNLKRATEADLGLVLMLYEDQDRIAEKIIEPVATAGPVIDFSDEQNVRHRLVAITEKADIDAIVNMMTQKTCVIADGHHRYTTGLTYAKQSPKPEAKYQMMAFTNICHEGLVVLPAHRLVQNVENFPFSKLLSELEKNFELTRYPFDDGPQAKSTARGKMLTRMTAEQKKHKSAFGIYGPGSAFYVAVLKDPQVMDAAMPDRSPAYRSLDVCILHRLVIEQILGINQGLQAKGRYLQYIKDSPGAIDEALAQIDAGQKQVAFFMNPVKMQQLMQVTNAGERMPPKSTYFYPKVYTGLTIYKL